MYEILILVYFIWLYVQSGAKRQEQRAIRDAVEAQALELSQQLRNFDTAILQCIECITTTSDEIVNTSLSKQTENLKIEGGIDNVKKTQNDTNGVTKLSQMQQNLMKSVKKRIFREIYRLNLALPALSLRHDVELHVSESQFVVIQGATGSG